MSQILKFQPSSKIALVQDWKFMYMKIPIGQKHHWDAHWVGKTTLETSGEDAKTTLETGGEDAKTTLELSGEDAKTTFETGVEIILIRSVGHGGAFS